MIFIIFIINIIISLLYFIDRKFPGEKILKFNSSEIWITLLIAIFNSANFLFLKFAEFFTPDASNLTGIRSMRVDNFSGKTFGYF